MVRKKKEDKLIDSQNGMYSELREVRWIYNPVVYSQLSGDFTLLQQRVLIGIVDKLQQRIIDSVEEQHKSLKFPDIFEESELMNRDTIEVILSASDLDVLPEHYDQLEESVRRLNLMTMKYPLFDGRGRLRKYVVASIFPRIEVSMSESELRRKGTLRVVMLTENIRDVFTMQYGFVRHVSHIAKIAMKKRTPRLYIYLSRFREMGKKKVLFSDLAEFLGLTDEYYKESNDGVNPYHTWRDVRRLVLDPVRDEMHSLADRGEIDFFFDYEPVYPEGKSRGIPDEVKFVIRKSAMGCKKSERDRRQNLVRQFTDAYTSWCPDLSVRQLKDMVSGLSEERLKRFVDFALCDVRRIVERKQPDDVASYVSGVLRRWLDEHLVCSEPVLFSDSEFHESVVPKSKSSQVEEGRYASEWRQILSEVSGSVKPLLERAVHRGSDRGFLWIEFPDRESLDSFNQMETSPATREDFRCMMDVVRRVLGESAGRLIVRGCAK